MTPTVPAAPIGTRFGQVAWVVPDIRAAETFFRDALGVPGFAKMEHLQARDLHGMYRGRPTSRSTSTIIGVTAAGDEFVGQLRSGAF